MSKKNNEPKRKSKGTVKKEESDEDVHDEEKPEEKLISAFNKKVRRKSEKRNLRFDLPSEDSQDSFLSALSQNSLEGEEDEYEDFSPPDAQNVLHKYIFSPLIHSQPRKAATKTCITKFSGSAAQIMTTTSSRQLFEVSKASPSPSDANVHLIRAVYLRKLEAAKEAITNGADVNTLSERQTPLLVATEIGEDRLVAYLLTIPNVNTDQQNEFGQTALTVAVRNAFDKIVRLLLSHKADVNIPDHMGRTPLHNALFQERPKLAKLLLAYGAKVEISDCFGEKPIFTASVKKPNLECLATLLKMGASTNYYNVSGIPLISRVVMYGTDISVIDLLVKFGASVNMPDLVSKKTPLHFAALKNNLKAARILVNNGADLNLTTTYNFTPIDEARFQRSPEVLNYLLSLGRKKRVVSRTVRENNSSKPHSLKHKHKKLHLKKLK